MNTQENKMTVETNPLAHLSESDFAALGMDALAYIKPAGAGVMIHAADGTLIGQAESQELAAFAVRQHGLDPVRIH